MNEYPHHLHRQLGQRMQPPLLLPATRPYDDNVFSLDASWSSLGNRPQGALVSTNRHSTPQRQRSLEGRTSPNIQTPDAEIQQSTRHYQFPQSNGSTQQSRRISMIVQTEMEDVNVSEGLSLPTGLLDQNQPYRSQTFSGRIEEESAESDPQDQNYTELPAELSQNSISVNDTTHQFQITKITTKIETREAYCLLKPFDFEMSKPPAENFVCSDVQTLEDSTSDTDSNRAPATPATTIISQTSPSTKKYKSSRALLMPQSGQAQWKEQSKHGNNTTIE
jgi:hypothetical protein